MDPGQDHDRRWRYLTRATTSRSTTRSPTRSRSATTTSARCSARPTRTATTCGPAGPATTAQGGGPVLEQRRERLRLDDLPRAARGRRGLLEDLPGHRRRPGRRPAGGAHLGRVTSATTATTRCCTSTSTGTRRPATRSTTRPRHRHRTWPRAGDGFFDILRRGREAAAGCRRSPGSSPRRRSPSTRTGPPTTAPGTSRRCSTRSPPTPRCGRRRRCSSRYDENDGFFDHVVPPVPTSGDGRRQVARCPLDHELFAGSPPGHVAGPYGLGLRVPMIVVSPWSTRRLRLLRGLRPHLAHPVHRARFGVTNRTSRRGAAPSAAT